MGSLPQNTVKISGKDGVFGAMTKVVGQCVVVEAFSLQAVCGARWCIDTAECSIMNP